MKKKFKTHKAPFIIGDSGSLSNWGKSGVADKCRMMKMASMDALSVELKNDEDWALLPKVYTHLKKQHMYLLGAIKRLPADKKKLFCLDGIRTNLSFYKNNTLFDFCHKNNTPLFVYVGGREKTKVSMVMKKIARKCHFPLVFMAKDPKPALFPFLHHIIHKNPRMYVGYQDSTEGVVSAILAFSWGGQFIEKKVRVDDISTSRTNSYTIPEFKIFSALLREGKKYLHWS